MKTLGIVVALAVGAVLVYAAAHIALIEVGQEVAVLHRWDGEGDVHRARLWIVDDDGAAWLHHPVADSPWVRRLATDPVVTVERNGEVRRYRATPEPDADPRIHELLREKYGFADRLVRFWVGTHEETGVLTGTTCTAVPVRLEPL